MSGEEGFELDRGERLDQYEILRSLGVGGMGQVYLARDMQLGRRVALKLVTVEHQNGFTGLSEARALAQFNHPNIVTIYGVGEFKTTPYIAMEYIEGETLRERMDVGQMSLQEVQRIALAIAQALEQAHCHDVIHADLKPENVVIGRDGRVRVLDFGLAKRVDSAAAPVEIPRDTPAVAETDEPSHETAERIVDSERKTKIVSIDNRVLEDDGKSRSTNGVVLGTPNYMAPEVWEANPGTSAVDIWALGVVMYELVTGQSPFTGVDMWGLAEQILSPAPAARVDLIRPVSDDLSQLVASCLSKAPQDRPSISSVVETLFRLVHGASSGALQTELSPFRGLAAFTEEHAAFFFGREEDVGQFVERMRTETVLPVIGASGVGKSSFIQAGVIPRLKENGEWRIVRMRPSSQPFMVLAERFWASRGLLSTGDDAASESIETLAQELFDNPKKLALMLQDLARTSGASVLLLVDQLEEICTLVQSEDVRLRFLAAICQAADDPDDVIRVVFSARDDFLTRLAESPEARAALSRVTVLRAPGKDALRDILEKPLLVLGHHYDDPLLVQEMIDAVAGESAALPLLQFCGSMLWDRRDRQAKALLRRDYEALGGVQGALATHANEFMRDLTEAQTRLVRDVMLRLVTPEGTRRVVERAKLFDALGPQSEDVLLKLTSSRLLSTREVLSEVSLELSHESLVHTWPRLVHWLDEGKEELVFLAEVDQAAELWIRRGRQAREVWTADALTQTLRNIDRYSAKLTSRAVEFLAACQAAERRRVRIRQWAIGSAAVTLIAIAAVSLVTAARFAEKTRVAREQTAQAQAEGARSAFIAGDYVNAKAQLRSSMEVADSALVRVLWAKLVQAPIVWTSTLPVVLNDMAVRPGEIASVGTDGNVYLLDASTAQTRTLRQHGEHLLSVAFSPDGRTLIAGDSLGQIAVWRGGDDYSKIEAHAGLVWKLAFSRSGDTFASASWDGTVKLFDTQSSKLIRTYDKLGGAVHRVAFHPNGRQLVVGLPTGVLRVFDLQGDASHDWQGLHSGPITALAFSPDGTLLLSGGEDKRVVISKDGQMLAHVDHAHEAGVTALAFDDKTVFSGSWDATIKRWSLPSLALMSTHTEHPGGNVTGLGVLPDGTLASAGFDKRVVVIDPSRSASQEQSKGHDGPVLTVAFGPNILYSGGVDGRVIAWDLATGDPLASTHDSNAQLNCLAISADGHWLAAGGDDTVVRVYALQAGRAPQLHASLRGHENAVRRCAFDAKGRLLTTGLDRTLKRWNTAKAVEDKSLDLGIAVDTIALSGDALVAAGPEDSHLWFAHSDSVPMKRKGGALGAAFLPDGRYVLMQSGGDLLRYGDGEKIDSVEGQGTDVAVNQPSGQIALASTKGVRLGPTRLRGHVGEVTRVAFSGDGSLLGTAGDDGTVRLWNTKTASPRWRTRAILRSSGSVLSQRGWSKAQQNAMVARVEASEGFVDEADGVYCEQLQDSVRLWQPETTHTPLKSTKIQAWNGGCLALAEGGNLHFLKGGTVTTLASNVHAFSATQQRLSFVVADQLRAVDERLVALPARKIDPMVSALADGSGVTFGGFPNGGFEVLRDAWRPLKLQVSNSGGVSAIVAGPLDTVAVGFVSGLIGLFSSRDGSLLVSKKLHGTVVSLALRGGVLMGVTDLGDSVDVDVSFFSDSRCALLDRVGQRVPFVWRDGEIVAAPAVECKQ